MKAALGILADFAVPVDHQCFFVQNVTQTSATFTRHCLNARLTLSQARTIMLMRC